MMVGLLCFLIDERQVFSLVFVLTVLDSFYIL